MFVCFSARSPCLGHLCLSLLGFATLLLCITVSRKEKQARKSVTLYLPASAYSCYRTQVLEVLSFRLGTKARVSSHDL